MDCWVQRLAFARLPGSANFIFRCWLCKITHISDPQKNFPVPLIRRFHKTAGVTQTDPASSFHERIKGAFDCRSLAFPFASSGINDYLG